MRAPRLSIAISASLAGVFARGGFVVAVFVLALAGAGTGVAQAGDVAAQAGEVTLAQALAQARTRAPELAAARASVAAAAGRRRQAELPRANPELGVDFRDDAPFAARGERRWGVELTQEIEIAGQRGLRSGVAEAELDAARADGAAFERALLARTAEVFYGLLHAQARAVLVADVAALNVDLVAVANRRLAAGDMAEVDHDMVVIEAERTRAEAVSAQADAVRARVELNRLLGRPAAADTRAAGAFPAVAEGEGARGTSAASERLDVEAARLEGRARAVEAALLAREAVPSPRLSLGYEHELRVIDAGGFTGDRDAIARIGGIRDGEQLLVLRLGVSLPAWNRNQGRIAEADARRAGAEARAEALHRAVDAEAAVARADVDAAAARLRILAAVAPAAARNLELLARAFAGGHIDAAALLAARDRAFRAQGEHLDAQHAYARARLSLVRALGLDPAVALDDARGDAAP